MCVCVCVCTYFLSKYVVFKMNFRTLITPHRFETECHQQKRNIKNVLTFRFI